MLQPIIQDKETSCKGIDNCPPYGYNNATRHVPPPAIIVLVSQLNHDAEALLVTSEKLSKRGFTTISVEAAKSNYSLPLAKACLTASS